MDLARLRYDDLFSASPNPRPTITPPESGYSWGVDKVQHLVCEYNAMIGELDKLSAVLVALGIDPREVLEAAS
jgi:hypothetical protein